MCQSINEGRALDLIEIDAASNRGIDEIRELREKINFAPAEARFKVYIIDEVHMLTPPAFNALLKTLEEPPPHAILILATTEAHKVPATIHSRCQRFDFRRLALSAMVGRLEQVCEGEGLEVEAGVLELVARSATGSLRDAENVLEQLQAYYGSGIDLAQTQTLLGITGDSRSWELLKHLLHKDTAQGFSTLGSVVDDGLDLRQFHRELLEHLRALLLVKAGAVAQVDLSQEALDDLAALAETISLGEISRALKIFGSSDLRDDAVGSLPLELSLVEYTLSDESGHQTGAEISKDTANTWPVAKREVRPAKPKAEKASRPSENRPQKVKKSEVGQQERPAVAEVSADTPTDVEPSERLVYLNQHWAEVIAASKGQGKGSIDAFLRSSCHPVTIEGDTVVLGFYHSFHKEKVEEVENKRVVESVLSQVLGSPHRLRCILTERKQKRVAQPQPDIPLVRAAQEMGAKIIEVEED
jgi:DNA polymerase-3 subunit gamma/tau